MYIQLHLDVNINIMFYFSGVIIFTWVVNHMRMVKLTKVDQFVMSYGGLRGAIAFCLVLLLDEKIIPQKRMMVTTTIVIVYFTVFIQVPVKHD